MQSSQPPYTLVAAEELRRFGADCYLAAGLSEADARTAAALLVRTELRGVETHGVLWFPHYCHALRAGTINPTPNIHCTQDLGAMLLVEGDGGLGHLISSWAMARCMERAAVHGVGVAAVRGSRHNGAASLYALQAQEAGFIGLSLTNGGVRVAPAGGREALLGTNPIAFAAPTASGAPFVMDMATSVVAGAKMRVFALKGQSIPAGWALDEEGRITTDPEAGDRGALLPLGSTLEMSSYKGFALGLVVETLCSALVGLSTGPEKARGVPNPGSGGAGHFLMAINIESLGDPAEFRERMARTLSILRESAPMEGVERIYTPGELEWLRETSKEREGAPILTATLNALRDLAVELGVREPTPLPEASAPR